MAHKPFEDFMVKLEVVPERVIVPGVCALSVPPVRIPPTLLPEELMAARVALEGRAPEDCIN